MDRHDLSQTACASLTRSYCRWAWAQLAAAVFLALWTWGLLPVDPLELPYTPGVRAIGIGSLIMAVKLVQWAVALRGKVDACSEWQALARAQLEEARTGLRWLPLGALLTAAVEWVGPGTLYLQAVIGVCLLLLLGALTWLRPMAELEPPSQP